MTKTIRTHDHWVTWRALYHFASQTSRATFSLQRQLKVFFFEKLRSNLKRVRFKFLKMQILPLKALLRPFQFCVCNRLLLTSALRWQLFCSFYSIRKNRPSHPSFAVRWIQSFKHPSEQLTCKIIKIWINLLEWLSRDPGIFVHSLKTLPELFVSLSLNLLWFKFARSWEAELSKVFT